MSTPRANGYYLFDVEHDPGLTRYGPPIALPRSVTSTPPTCGWLLGATEIECGKPATRGTEATGPLCDEHGEQHERDANR